MTSKVGKIGQKCIFAHKLTTNRNFQLNCYEVECTGLWDIKGSEGFIYAAFKNPSDEEYSGKATKIHQRAFGNDHPITARSLELLATVYAEIGKTEYTNSLGECVSTLSKRFSATESFSDALSSISHSHKDRHSELRHRKEPYKQQETLKTKVINEKLPTSILKRSNVSNVESDSSRRRKNERRVRFREPEITVHVYDTPQSHLHLALLTCLFLLLSALGLALYCTDRRRPQRACEELQTALAVYLLQFKQIVWACWIWLTMQ
ncbi:hypothetical protein DPX16_19418 [Anabarilius grahami]|uniref:Consortin C-terminal domain-containing protein n=1 Tax=Anabarilius grahami TaxID=495550 RepID=A0A3N0Z019_ANAGA|nr:hypothetical protein DPX16_19418 [Anabarilius grahami]